MPLFTQPQPGVSGLCWGREEAKSVLHDVMMKGSLDFIDNSTINIVLEKFRSEAQTLLVVRMKLDHRDSIG